jgi:hypothetical protein
MRSSCADDGAGKMRLRLQRGEGDCGNDGKEDLRAQPDNQREIKQRAKKGLHPSAS